ncbi:unnamed protein product [Brachionus calyciflorus]|uniref:Major facilitator superfamily (MFS) profile domain-containing protein n=1 Tax=Brachionus calyciflorus TaxID=104777 RepID=A0A814J7B5_9BILA|nr:unnamed protein product [Brachionus calyciflorus]
MIFEKEMKETLDEKSESVCEMKEKKEFTKPDGGYGWVILFVAFTISFILDGCMYSFGIILDEIKNHYGVAQEIANLITSFNTGFLFLSGTLSAAFAKQFGCRIVVMVSAFIFSGMYFLSALVSSIYYLHFLFGIIGGIAFGCTYLTCFIILVEYFDKKLGLANGLTMAGSGLGATAFAPLTHFLNKYFGWKYTMMILAGLVFLCFFLGALLRPIEYYYKKIRQEDDNDEENFDSVIPKQTTSEIIIEIFKEMTNFRLLRENSLFLLMTMSNFFIFFVYFIVFIYIPVRAKELKIENYAIILSIIGFVNIPCRIIFGILSDKVIKAIYMNTFSVFLASVSTFSFYYLTTIYSQAVFAVFFAISAAGMNCLSTPYLVDIVGSKSFANANGILNIFRGISCIAGPFIAGFLTDKLGSNLYAFVFCGSSLAIAAILSAIVALKTIKNEKVVKANKSEFIVKV